MAKQGIKLQLPSEVTDTTLPRLGEFEIPLKAYGTFAGHSQILITMNAGGSMLKLKNAIITGSTGTDNVGTEQRLIAGNNQLFIKATAADASITITDKSDIIGLGSSGTGFMSMWGSEANGVYPIIDIDNLPTSIQRYNNRWGASQGSIQSILNYPDLISFEISKENISSTNIQSIAVFKEEWITGYLPNAGDIGYAPGRLPNLTSFVLNTWGDYSLSIDTFAGSNLTNLTVSQFAQISSRKNNSKLTGSLSSLSGSTMGRYMINPETTGGQVAGFSDEVTGSIDVFDSKPLTNFIISRNTTIGGNAGKVGTSIVRFNAGANANITSFTAPSGSYTGDLVYFESPNCIWSAGTTDAFLNKYQSRTFAAGSWIAISGTRTTASDAAVAAIKAKGCPVYLNGVSQ